MMGWHSSPDSVSEMHDSIPVLRLLFILYHWLGGFAYLTICAQSRKEYSLLVCGWGLGVGCTPTHVCGCLLSKGESVISPLHSLRVPDSVKPPRSTEVKLYFSWATLAPKSFPNSVIQRRNDLLLESTMSSHQKRRFFSVTLFKHSFIQITI